LLEDHQCTFADDDRALACVTGSIWWHGEAQVTVAGGQLTELLRTRVPTFETGREKSAPLPANFRTF
jgi:hypothetical protein